MAGRKGKVVRIPPERWQRGASDSWQERRTLIDRSYRLFAELAQTRIREQHILDEIRHLPPLPVTVGVAVLSGLLLVLLPVLGPVMAGEFHPGQRRQAVAASPTVSPSVTWTPSAPPTARPATTVADPDGDGDSDPDDDGPTTAQPVIAAPRVATTPVAPTSAPSATAVPTPLPTVSLPPLLPTLRASPHP